MGSARSACAALAVAVAVVAQMVRAGGAAPPGPWKGPALHYSSPVAPFAAAGVAASKYTFNAGFVLPPVNDTATASAFAMALNAPSVTWHPPQWPVPKPIGYDRVLRVHSDTARHIEANDPGIGYNLSVSSVDLVIATTEAWGTLGRCIVTGLNTQSGAGKQPTPAWTQTIQGCVTPPIDTAVRLSDDGTTVILGAYLQGQTPTLIAFDAQSGKQLQSYAPKGGEALPVMSGVSCDRQCARVAVTFGNEVHVFNSTNGELVCPPIQANMDDAEQARRSATGTAAAEAAAAPAAEDLTGPAHLCPMGVFLITGNSETTVRRWNPKAAGGASYSVIWRTNLTKAASAAASTPASSAPASASPSPSASPWHFALASTTVNGEDMNLDGCVVGITWAHASGRQVRVDAYSMLTKQHYFTYTSPANAAAEVQVTAINMHLDYIAVSTWGDNSTGTSRAARQAAAAGGVPQVLLFQLRAPQQPILSFASPGSMMGVDLFVSPWKAPPLAATGATDAPRHVATAVADATTACLAGQPGAAHFDTVYAVAAGAHVHASDAAVGTSGGDAYYFLLSCPSHPAPPKPPALLPRRG